MLAALGALGLAARSVARSPTAAAATVALPLPRLPRALNGLTIQVVSDLHVRSPRTPSLKALHRLAGTRPDFLFACGDLSDRVDAAPFVAEALAAIEPVYGAYAVWGNHDLFVSRDATDPAWIGYRTQPLGFMRQVYRAHGITVLNNAHVCHRIGGAEFAIVGIGDATHRGDDAVRAVDGLDEDAFTLVLTHNPDAVPRLGQTRVDLVVCGHTHGGQIVPPFMTAPMTSTRLPLLRPSGLMHIDGRLVFITRGVGTVGIPMRVNAPAEVPRLTLVRVAEPAR